MTRLLSLLAALLIALAPAEATADEDDDDSALVTGDDDSALAPTHEDVGRAIEVLVVSGRSAPHAALAGAILTLLVFAQRKTRLMASLPPAVVPWVAGVLGMAGGALMAVSTGVSVPTAVVEGFLLGAVAVGFWEMAFKHLLNKSKGDGGDTGTP